MKKPFFKLLLLIFLAASTAVKAQQEIKLYNGPIPNSNNCPDNEKWSVSITGRKIVKNVTVPTLTVFLPEKQNAIRSAIIICPGGGYADLSIVDGGTETAKELVKYGITVFVLKYRLSDEKCNINNSLVPLQDVQQAMYRVRKESQKYNIDPAKVGLLGFSAGGHLAATAATHYNDPQIKAEGISLRPDFTILAYPVISFMDALTSKKSRTRGVLLGKNPSDEQIKWFSAELNVNSSTPPAFLIQASDDSTSLVENSIAYYQALHHYKIAAKLIVYQKGGHGFAAYNKAEDDHWLPYAVNWMRLNLFLK